MLQKLFGIDGVVAVWRRRLFSLVEALLFILVLGVLVVVIVQVVGRYVFSIPTPWAEEVSKILLIWVVMIGAAVAMDRKEHYAINFLVDRCAPSWRLAVLGFANLLGVIFLVFLVDLSWSFFSGRFSTYIHCHRSAACGGIFLASAGCGAHVVQHDEPVIGDSRSSKHEAAASGGIEDKQFLAGYPLGKSNRLIRGGGAFIKLLTILLVL